LDDAINRVLGYTKLPGNSRLGDLPSEHLDPDIVW